MGQFRGCGSSPQPRPGSVSGVEGMLLVPAMGGCASALSAGLPEGWSSGAPPSVCRIWSFSPRQEQQ